LQTDQELEKTFFSGRYHRLGNINILKGKIAANFLPFYQQNGLFRQIFLWNEDGMIVKDGFGKRICLSSRYFSRIFFKSLQLLANQLQKKAASWCPRSG